jgi:hypothetical protein
MTPVEYNDSEFVKWRDKCHALEISVARLQEQEKASDKALTIATDALKHSQSVSNEWRKENLDQRALFPTTNKVDGQFATEGAERRALEARVLILEKSGNVGEGKHSAFEAVWVKFAVVVTLLIALAGLIQKLMGK